MLRAYLEPQVGSSPAVRTTTYASVDVLEKPRTTPSAMGFDSIPWALHAAYIKKAWANSKALVRVGLIQYKFA